MRSAENVLISKARSITKKIAKAMPLAYVKDAKRFARIFSNTKIVTVAPIVVKLIAIG